MLCLRYVSCKQLLFMFCVKSTGHRLTIGRAEKNHDEEEQKSQQTFKKSRN